MCPGCISCTEKAKHTLPEDELWQLYRAAYKQYKSEILNGEKSYSRYVNDFVSYHLPATCLKEADVRLHVMHVWAVGELLEDRRDLVDAFFSKDKFLKSDFQKMNELFNSGKVLEEEPVCLAHFSDEQISLITKFANEVCLFSKCVSEANIKALFECRLAVPLQASSNRHVALFFSALSTYGFLPYRWQIIVASYRLVASSASNEPLTSSQLSSSLSQAKCVKLMKAMHSNLKVDDKGFEFVCNDFAKRLKESM